MNFADQNVYSKLLERIAAIEAELAAAKMRIAELEAKRGPGRPPKEAKAA